MPLCLSERRLHHWGIGGTGDGEETYANYTAHPGKQAEQTRVESNRLNSGIMINYSRLMFGYELSLPPPSPPLPSSLPPTTPFPGVIQEFIDEDGITSPCSAGQ